MKKNFLKIITTSVLTSTPILSSVACTSKDQQEEKRYFFQNSLFSSREEAERQLIKIARKVKKDKISIINLLFSSAKVRDITLKERIEYFYLNILEFVQKKFQILLEKSSQGTQGIHKKIEKSFSKLKKSYVFKEIIINYENKVNYLKIQQQSIDFNPKELQEHKPLLKNHLTFCSENKDQLFIVKSKKVFEYKNSFFFRIKPLGLFNQIWLDVLKFNQSYRGFLNGFEFFQKINSILNLFSGKNLYFDSLDSLFL